MHKAHIHFPRRGKKETFAFSSHEITKLYTQCPKRVLYSESRVPARHAVYSAPSLALSTRCRGTQLQLQGQRETCGSGDPILSCSYRVSSKLAWTKWNLESGWEAGGPVCVNVCAYRGWQWASSVSLYLVYKKASVTASGPTAADLSSLN